MTVKLLMLVVFFSIMLGVGFYSRRHATNVNDFVLEEGALAPGSLPLPTAPPTFPPLYSSVTPDSSDGNTAWPPPGLASATP